MLTRRQRLDTLSAYTIERLLAAAERAAGARFAETAAGATSARRRLVRGLPIRRDEASTQPAERRGAPPQARRRAPTDRLTDVYNAISIAHVVPVGGEELDRYPGPASLVRADGEESFDTVVRGEPVVESPHPGEVVWRGDLGVTCRRWNWRQCARTRLTGNTTRRLFILDALASMGDEALDRPDEALVDGFCSTNPNARATMRRVPSGS